MYCVGKVVLLKCYILKNIFFSFFSGVKIGVFGLNGVGKFILLCIMVGIDIEIEGEVCLQFGIKIGYLLQELQFNLEYIVCEFVEEVVVEVVNVLKGLDEVYVKYVELDVDFDKFVVQ